MRSADYGLSHFRFGQTAGRWQKASRTCDEASLFVRLISYRHGHGAIMLTTNKNVRDWPDLFAEDQILAAAILDRLPLFSHVLNIKGRPEVSPAGTRMAGLVCGRTGRNYGHEAQPDPGGVGPRNRLPVPRRRTEAGHASRTRSSAGPTDRCSGRSGSAAGTSSFGIPASASRSRQGSSRRCSQTCSTGQ